MLAPSLGASSHVLNDFGLGRLLRASGNGSRTLDYQPIEVSRSCLHMVSYAQLTRGEILQLENDDLQLFLQVGDAQPYAPGEGLTRYELFRYDSAVDLEDIFAKYASIDTDSKTTLFEPIRFSRFKTDTKLLVHAKLFGTVGIYSLTSLNVSRSGLLLTSDRQGEVPFRENSLVEITIVPRGDVLFMPIQALAKVVRVEDAQNMHWQASKKFALKFLEFQDQGQVVWDQTIELIEQTQNRLQRDIAANDPM